jgi:hypothetical protein
MPDTSRVLVVTVNNQPATMEPRAGSTRPDYLISSYTVSNEARAVVKALAHDYRLSEVSAWTISPLHAYCVVFRAATTDRMLEAITQLQYDPRVLSAEPLHEYQVQSSNPTAAKIKAVR